MSELQLIPAMVATSASALLGRSVLGPDGKVCGQVKDLAVDVSKDQAHVAALILRPAGGKKAKKVLLPVVDLVLPVSNEAELRAKAKPVPYKEHHDYLLLDYDLLDQQIIDVDGRKVVRVNDVNLAWEPGAKEGETSGLRIEEVEVGNRGAMRRLFKGLPVAMVDGFTERLKPRVIPWACVDLIERDPARRVRLKIGQERLSKLHPSDIADILEDLAPGEREAVFSSLPEETAAETLEEVDPKMQKALLQGLDSERAADILEEMDPGAAADVLAEMSDEESEAILEEMEPEERHEVEELLEFSADSAAGRMTTDYVSVPMGVTVADAIEALREFEGDPDTITEIYLLDEHEKLAGVVMLPRLVLSTAETTLAVLSEGHNVRCGLDASAGEVAELFDKYNLRSLPVVDQHGRVAGAIHAEQVIAQLREG
ncbi:MAG TPA: CBS domain-containing protein [Acidobacteriaceae bacterium]|nr:CBS domain-containing protein [Acidobacteriaceae bacterium]